MKIALTADWQFDLYPRYSTILPNGKTSRLRDLEQGIQWVVDTAMEKKCERLFVLGDIFDDRTSLDIMVLDSVARSLKYASLKMQTSIIPGNHDSYLRNPRINSLNVFASTVQVFGEPSVMSLKGLTVGLLPWTEDVASIEDSVNTLLKKGAKILLTHALLKGVVSASGIPLDILQPKKWDAIFLGDVHEPKVISPTVRYVGSPMHLDYRDYGGNRGFVIYDTESKKSSHIVNPFSPRFHIVQDDGGTFTNVAKGDFVRVRSADPKVSKTVVERYTGIATQIDSDVVEDLDENVPRMKVKVADDSSALLSAYVRHVRPEDDAKSVERLTRLGLEILSEVRH